MRPSPPASAREAEASADQSRHGTFTQEPLKLAWFGYTDQPRVLTADRLLFDRLKALGQLR